MHSFSHMMAWLEDGGQHRLALILKGYGRIAFPRLYIYVCLWPSVPHITVTGLDPAAPTHRLRAEVLAAQLPHDIDQQYEQQMSGVWHRRDRSDAELWQDAVMQAANLQIPMGAFATDDRYNHVLYTIAGLPPRLLLPGLQHAIRTIG